MNSTSITISWDRVACLERNSEITGYILTYSTATATSGQTFENAVNISGTGPENRVFTVSELLPQTDYIFTVRAVNSDGLMGPPATLSARTTENPPVITTSEFFMSTSDLFMSTTASTSPPVSATLIGHGLVGGTLVLFLGILLVAICVCYCHLRK